MIISRVRDRNTEYRDDGREIHRILESSSSEKSVSISMLISKIPGGCVEASHRHRDSVEIFYCLSNAEVVVNDQTISMEKGDVMLLDSLDTHKIEARHPMELLVIKTPVVDDKIEA